MRLGEDEARARLAAHDHGVLCTVHPSGASTPCPSSTRWTTSYVGVPVDRVKPKASSRLQRERNLEADPRATLLVEHWDRDDWSRLWWVRAELRFEGDAARREACRAGWPSASTSTATSPSTGAGCCVSSAIRLGREGVGRPDPATEEERMAVVLAGRHALVTGGARGLGAGMAQALAAAGAAVMIGDVPGRPRGGDRERVRRPGPLTSTSATRRRGSRRRGDGRAARRARHPRQQRRHRDLGPDRRRRGRRHPRMLEVNVLGTALGIKHGLRAMRPGGAAGNGGAIVNIASVAATIAFPGIAGYSATKSAVDRLTRVAAFEAGKLGFGVRVNCVYPGLVPTEMGQKLAVDMAELGLFESPEAAVGAVIEQTPAGRLGEVSDMADAVVFLASDQARFITGAGLPVDGGMGM
jgi:NAD(P)-dependent dehydrogenase (short-subunit alcohol dehydrogenase family)